MGMSLILSPNTGDSVIGLDKVIADWPTSLNGLQSLFFLIFNKIISKFSLLFYGTSNNILKI